MSFLNFGGNQGVTFKSFTSSGGTTYTLDVAASTNSVMVSAGGILQKPGVDYSVENFTLTTSSVITSGIVLDTWTLHKPGSAPVIQDNSITNAKMQDDAIGIAELSATGTPSSSNFLRGDNSWAEAGGGAWTLIGSQDAETIGSSPASLTQTGLDVSTYDSFGVIFSSMHPSNDDVYVQIRMGDSSGVDSGSSDYAWGAAQLPSYEASFNSGVNSRGAVTQSAIRATGQDSSTDMVGSAAGEGWSANVTLHAGGTDMYPHLHGTGYYRSAQPHPRMVYFGGQRLSQITVDRIDFSFSAGTIVSGRMTTYGIKHS